jgi:hypothetical protein
MPASLFWRMAAYANRSFERRVQAAQLSKDSSYETGARCLLQWVRDNKSRFNKTGQRRPAGGHAPPS